MIGDGLSMLVDDIKKQWALVSPDGGSRWYVGCVVDDGDGSKNGRLSPVYGYVVGRNEKGWVRDVVPILALSGHIQLECAWTMRIDCDSLSEDEIHELAELVLVATDRQAQLRASRSPLVRA